MYNVKSIKYALEHQVKTVEFNNLEEAQKESKNWVIFNTDSN